MQVEKYKKKKSGIYTVTFSNGREMDLYEEVILRYELLLKKEIDARKLTELISFQEECDVYYVALKYIKARLRSCYEVSEFLKKRDYPQEFIDSAVSKLVDQGYLNDYQYASSFLHEQFITTSRGPNKIIYELTKKGIAKDIIEEVMSSYTKEVELEKIQKIVTRMIKSNHNKSVLMLKKKIEQDLLYQGFDRSNIFAVLANTSFPDDHSLYQKEYEKLYRKLSKKYSGDLLKHQMKQKLYQKGFRYED